VDVDSIYSAYEAKAEPDAVLPDIQAALEHEYSSSLAVDGSPWIIDPKLIVQLSAATSPD
jgi:hypothetical protein